LGFRGLRGRAVGARRGRSRRARAVGLARCCPPGALTCLSILTADSDGGPPMRVATWRGESRFTLDEVPEPVPGPGQVKIAVHTAGVCGSDVHAIQGLFPATPPRVMGHEYSGVVVEVGRGVSRRLVGRAVACEPNYGCGACEDCRLGRD